MTMKPGRGVPVEQDLQLELDPRVVARHPAEKCLDCGCGLPADRKGLDWEFCEYCREAVCDACETGHACEAFRENRPRK